MSTVLPTPAPPKRPIFPPRRYGARRSTTLIPVSKNDLYDLASVTKVLASTLAIMKLYELYGFNIKDPVSKWIPSLKKSNKQNHSFKQILSHSAGWLPYIAHQNLVLNKRGKFKRNTLSNITNFAVTFFKIDTACIFPVPSRVSP